MANHSPLFKALACIGLFVCASLLQSADACTGVYIGPKCSASGNVIIARSADSDKFQRHLEITPAVKNGKNRVITDMTGFSWELPRRTYRYVSVPYADITDIGRYDSAVTNECGLAISATVTGYICQAVKDADPSVPDGIGELTLPTILGSCCRTAREAIGLTARIIDEKGSCEQNILMVADKDEAWYMEIYCGHQYCAVKMPDDRVAAFGNEFMLASVDPTIPDVICSEGLFSIPETNGFAVYDADGKMHLSRTYMGCEYYDFCHMRTWGGHRLLSPSTAGEYDPNAYYPLFYEPDGKVSLQDVFAIFRDRYEGTPYCPEINSDPLIRVIGDESQGMVHAIEVYSDLPAEMACVTWLTLTEAAYAPFIPVSNAIKSCNPLYRHEMKRFRYDPETAALVYKRLNALSAQNREKYGANVRKYWEMVEDALVEDFPAKLAELAKGRKAVKKLTKYCTSLQDAALADARRIFDELTWYMVNTNYTYAYIYDFNKPLEPAPMNMAPFEPMCDIASIAAKKGWTAHKGNGLFLLKDGAEMALMPSNGHRTDLGSVMFTQADGSVTKIAARVEDADGKIMVPVSVAGMLN